MDLKVTLHVVLFAFVTWALDDRVELLRVHDLIDLKPAKIASRHRNLDAWLHITSAGDNTTNSHEGADLLGTNFTELCDMLFSLFTWHNDNLIVAAKLGWELVFAQRNGLIFNSGLSHLLGLLLDVETALLHEEIEGGEIFLFEVDCGLGHILVHCI